MSQSKNEESKPNSKLTIEVGRKFEPQTEEKWLTAEILQGCKVSQPAEFRRLRNFATCSASIALLPFHHLFYFFLNFHFCIVGSLDIFVISLDSEHYISLSQALYKETTLCNKIGAKVSSFPTFLLLSDFSLLFLHFLTVQTLLEDDNSRDAWLNPIILEEEGHWAKILK